MNETEEAVRHLFAVATEDIPPGIDLLRSVRGRRRTRVVRTRVALSAVTAAVLAAAAAITLSAVQAPSALAQVTKAAAQTAGQSYQVRSAATLVKAAGWRLNAPVTVSGEFDPGPLRGPLHVPVPVRGLPGRVPGGQRSLDSGREVLAAVSRATAAGRGGDAGGARPYRLRHAGPGAGQPAGPAGPAGVGHPGQPDGSGVGGRLDGYGVLVLLHQGLRRPPAPRAEHQRHGRCGSPGAGAAVGRWPGDAGYVTTEKNGSGVTARTSVALTHNGRAALDRYTTVLRGLLDSASATSAPHVADGVPSPGRATHLGSAPWISVLRRV